MRKIKIISIGRDKAEWLTEGIAHYLKLLKKFARLEMVTLPSVKNASSLPQEMLLEKEAEIFRKELGDDKYLALWDRGKVYDSAAFARYVEKQFLQVGQVTLVIGGPYGLHQSIITRGVGDSLPIRDDVYASVGAADAAGAALSGVFDSGWLALRQIKKVPGVWSLQAPYEER